MKLNKIPLILTALALIASCKPGRTLLPNVSGKAGEVVVVMDKENWEKDLGSAVRNTLGADCPYLYQREPLYSLVNVTRGNFADMFRIHRNILIFNMDDSTAEPGIIYRNDEWAHPQCVIQINASGAAEATSLFNENSARILATIEQAERDRVIANSIQYENREATAQVKQTFGGSPHFPIGYKLKKLTEDFAWVADEKPGSLIQGIFVYRHPASEKENFSVEALTRHRNTILAENVPGMFDNTWMTTSTYIKPTVEFLRFRGRQLAQMRGFWEVQNDYMGGPFVSHSFYGPENMEIITVEGFVYAPRYDKRQYLRQVESIVYSFEWETKE